MKPRIVSWFKTSLASVRPAFAMRQAWREGYGFGQLRQDLMAGAVVGVVAIPLSMALAIASGVPPEHGLYTAIIAGALIALLGGSRVQVSGPTAAFVVILAPISARYGLQGLAMASAMAGVLLVLMGVMRLGRLIEFIPHPVTTGFTAGIAVVIATLQLKDFFGLKVAASGPDAMYLEKAWKIIEAAPTLRWGDFGIGALTLATLAVWPRVTRKVPGALVALSVAGVLGYAMSHWLGVEVVTIANKFAGGIPSIPPLPVLPWHDAGPAAQGGEPLAVTPGLIHALLPAAFTIAMLGSIESLLSAVVADGMAQTRHDPDTELFAQGLGNIVAPFFGGFAATGAIAANEGPDPTMNNTHAAVEMDHHNDTAITMESLFNDRVMAADEQELGRLEEAVEGGVELVARFVAAEARCELRDVRHKLGRQLASRAGSNVGTHSYAAATTLRSTLRLTRRVVDGRLGSCSPRRARHCTQRRGRSEKRS